MDSNGTPNEEPVEEGVLMYVDLVQYPDGKPVAINPFQVASIAKHEDREDVTVLFIGVTAGVFGEAALVREVLSGNREAIATYDKVWLQPALKTGPRSSTLHIPRHNGMDPSQ